jgi:hypothetical protein
VIGASGLSGDTIIAVKVTEQKWRIAEQFRYTVTKANKNEALLYKIVVLGMEKGPKKPLVLEKFFPRPY